LEESDPLRDDERAPDGCCCCDCGPLPPRCADDVDVVGKRTAEPLSAPENRSVGREMREKNSEYDKGREGEEKKSRKNFESME
jgi:hypothetical protein